MALPGPDTVPGHLNQARKETGSQGGDDGARLDTVVVFAYMTVNRRGAARGMEMPLKMRLGAAARPPLRSVCGLLFCCLILLYFFDARATGTLMAKMAATAHSCCHRAASVRREQTPHRGNDACWLTSRGASMVSDVVGLRI
jgi:hypothetical protein